MSQGLVERQYLEDIADAIRSKNGSSDTYTPAEMAQAISGIHTADEVVLVQKTVNANGQYNASDDSADGYSGVRVNVPNSYSASDEGKVVSNGDLVTQTTKQITANGTHDTTTNNSVSVDVPNSYTTSDNGKVVVNQALVAQTSKNVNANGTHDTTANNSVVVDVPNSYATSDEGKVVSGGALISQSSRTITSNGTYNTTLISETIVNVSGGGGGSSNILYGKSAPSASEGQDGDIYLLAVQDIFGIPTANTGADYEITSDRGVYRDAYQYKAFRTDGVWGSATNARPAWLKYKFLNGKKAKISSLNFQTYVSAYGGGFSATAFEFQGSNDDFDTYDTLYSYNGNATEQIQTVDIVSNTEYSAFRFWITAITGDRYPAVNRISAEGALNDDSADSIIKSIYLKVNGVWVDIIGQNIDDVNVNGG